MGSTIKARTFSSVVDNRIRLSNSNFARLWSSDVGTSWTTIRVGCRMSMEDSGASLTSTPRFAFGICSGTSNLFMDATTTHWMGAVSGATGWVRATASSVVYYNLNDGISNPLYLSKRIGGTLTVGTLLLGGSCGVPDCTVAARQCLFLDITKGSPNFTCKIFQNSTPSVVDVTLATYLSQLPLTTPTITGHSQGSGITIAIDEATNGYFNAVNVAWDRTSPAIEISDIAVVKLA